MKCFDFSLFRNNSFLRPLKNFVIRDIKFATLRVFLPATISANKLCLMSELINVSEITP